MATDEAPVIGDGLLTILIPEEKKKMAMDESTKVMFEQSFANQHQGNQHAFRRLQDGQDNVAEQTRLSFVLTQQLVGAKAAGNLNMDPLGKAILDQRSVKNQPNVA